MQVLYRRPLHALLVATALWGGAVCGTKYALRGFDPLTLLSIELVAATAALWSALLIRGYRPPPSWRLAALLGLLEPALAYLGDTLGLSRTTAIDAAVISGLESALVVVLAAVLLREAVTRSSVVSVAVALGGLVVLAGGGGGQRAMVGDLFVAGGMLSASLYTVVAKRLEEGSDVLSLTTWQFTGAGALSLAVTALGWCTGSERAPTAAAPRYWMAAILVGIGGFGVSFFLYNVVISRVDASWTAIVLNLIPVFGLLGAVVFLGERPTASAGLGAGLIGASVVCFTVSDRRGVRGRLSSPVVTNIE